ncbi:MAG: SDR family oxidoreductase [Bacteroidota bacterium]
MQNSSKWALILGGSSGLGLATAEKLGKHGFNLIIVHRDRKSDMEEIQLRFQRIASYGIQLVSYNKDAVNPETRKELIKAVREFTADNGISIVVHSIAKGNVKPMQGQDSSLLTGLDFRITIDAMAISLYDWVHDLVSAGAMALDTRIIAFTSEGNTRAIRNYAAVSAAKTALEAIVRNIALEFALMGIKANCIQAGVTDTRSFRMIPNSDAIKNAALIRNPNYRLTSPEDVANAAYLLTLDEAKWITGTVIKVDGGESLQ